MPMLLASAMQPMRGGATAPPTMVIIRYDEACLVLPSAPRRASEKIVGNIMLSHRYTKKKAPIDILPPKQTITKLPTVAPTA